MRLILLLCALSTSAWAEVEFFREPSSLFPSGSEHLETLNRTSQQEISKTWVKVNVPASQPSQQGWIRSSLIIKSTDLAPQVTVAAGAPMLQKPVWNLSQAISLPRATTARVIERKEDWLHLQLPSGRYWTPESYLSAKIGVLGYALTKQSVRLFEKPQAGSKSKKTIPQITKVETLNWAIPEDIDQTWVRVRAQNMEGFLPLDMLVTPLDFARAAITHDGSRHELVYHFGGWIKSHRQKRIPVAEVTSLELAPWAIVSSPLANIRSEPSLQAEVLTPVRTLEPLQILEQKTVRWRQSFLKSHGLVWWKVEDPAPVKAPGRTLTNQQLFVRPLFDLATSPVDPKLMVASADGVYIRKGEDAWQEVPEFEGQNHPVSFSPTGTLFVGPQMSVNAGVSFQPYLKWEKVAQALRKALASVPTQLRLTDIQAGDKSLQIEIEIGKKRLVQLKSYNSGNSWNLEPIP